MAELFDELFDELSKGRFKVPGGITPPSRKAHTRDVPLRMAPLPARATLSLNQHAGTPATPCVTPGQRVLAGERIAAASGALSADLHASISGHVAAIDAAAIIIASDGLDEWQHVEPLEWRSCDIDTLLTRLDHSGVVGLGGATFPTHIKARVRQRHAIDTLIVNAAECEPYISCDDATLRAHADDVMEGARLMAHLAGAEKILIGIEDDTPEALAALRTCLDDNSSQHASTGDTPVSIVVIPTRYPSGGERQLIQRLLGREVPSGGLPADIGVLCHNPGTLRAALHAVRDGKPLVSRAVTLSGQALQRPGNVIARLGTPLIDLLEFAGLDIPHLHRLIRGGPLMGQPLSDLNTPLTKGTNCLIAATQDELPDPAPEMPCIRCAACEEVCPAGLLPQQLYWFAKGKEYDRAQRWQLFDCIECGACDYVCPSHIPLVDYYRASKDAIRQQHHEAAKADHARHRFELRQARLAREEAEKQARRAARRSAATRKTPSTVNTDSMIATSDAPGTASAASRKQATPKQTGQKQDSQAELRSLRIAQSAARSAQRKAERTLSRAIESGEDAATIADLETLAATARENLLAADAQLAAARDAASQQHDGTRDGEPRNP